MHGPNPAAVLLLLAIASSVAAQPSSHAFVEASIGASRGFGGAAYHTRESAMLLVSVGAQPHRDRSFMFAVHSGLLGARGDDICPATTPTGCLPQYPMGGMLALTVGARSLSPGWRGLEWAAGPARIGAVGGGGSGSGLLLRMRLGVPPGHYVSPGFLLQGVLARMDGATLFSGGVGVTLRLW
jgi:hypothetical protein